MKETVYCKDCKWIIDENICCYSNNVKVIEEKVATLKFSLYMPGLCCVINKDNNCKDYKRKWWKFWIREKK